jgi:hypothetical protein
VEKVDMQPGFFDLEDRLELLEKLGDPLPNLSRVVDWEAFRPLLSGLRKELEFGRAYLF